jgi:hypothetical protein
MYLAVRENDSKEIARISESRGIPLAEVLCDGCLSEKVFIECINCRHGFRRCASEKKVTWCFECPDFPCKRLEKFRDIHVVRGVSHHNNVIEDLRYMKDHGVKRFVDEQKTRGHCPHCGKKLYWYLRECPRCHANIID